MSKYKLTRKNPLEIDKITLFKGAALLGTGVGAYYLFRKSAIPVIGGASAYLIASVLKATEIQSIMAAAAGTGIAFTVEKALQKKKDDSWCKEHWIQAMLPWNDRCDDTSDALAGLSDDHYGYTMNWANPGRVGRFNCLWKGAKDVQTKDDVSELIKMLHEAGYPPSSYPTPPPDNYVGVTYINAIFDAGVEEAVKKFQQSKGLNPDGVVGPDTWSALGKFKVQTLNCPEDVKTKSMTSWTPSAVTPPPDEETKNNDKPTPMQIPWWAWAVTGVGVASITGIAIYNTVKKKKRATAAQT